MTPHHIELWVPGLAGAVRPWGWLFADRRPHAGGPQSYAAYLADAGGYEVELAAGPP